MKKLSFTMLRGLFSDIINDTAKPNLYSFGKYKICVIDKCKEEDIKKLDRFMIPRTNSNLNKKEKDNKRFREMYADRRKRGVCIRCGDKNKKLETLQSGREGIMCERCSKMKKAIDKKGYNRRRYNP